ncbi:estrogen sulfotransferase-like [Diaphorina citri]|uniref:Estrogen sulfotransferase-like n=2 Tax=Diaphorina citri TaxID=121845 RepID=A0A3Q0JAI4_DIACI|nr:estrogen sulfotransferase-like [Diaphorina citri]
MLQFESVSDETEIGKLLRSKFTCSFRTGYVRCKGVCMPEYYVNFAEDIINMDVRDDDVWVCSFPKTGTTWTQEMVWCIANDLDFEAAKEILPARFPFLELTPLFDYRNNPNLDAPDFEENSVVHIQNLKGRRFIKAHLPFKLLPKKLQSGTTNAKIIYVTRNPKDTCVSYYHHCHLMEGYRGDFDDFLKLFLNDAVCFAPYWDHVLEFWAVAKKRDNVLFIKYEDMKKDLGSIITQVATHLDKSLTDDQVDILKQHLSFESMKSNPATNYEFAIDFNKENKLIDDKFCAGKFMRSGQVGGWKAVMTPEIVEQFDPWTRTKTKGSDFSF